MLRAHSVSYGLFLAAVACSPVDPLDDSAPAPESVAGEVVLELASVPTGVQCVAVTISGSQTVTRQLTVTPGPTSATLSLGQLFSGSASFRANAYNVACASTASMAPTWIADPVTAELRPGVVTSVEMTFRPNNPVTVSANFLGNVVEVSAGRFATYARMSDGTVRFWGSDTSGGFSLLPVPFTGLTNVAHIAAGSNFACALAQNGNVSCWGFVDDGNRANGIAQVPLNGIPAVEVVAGYSHACALLANGSVACWGRSNAFGELGDGSTTPHPSSSPVFTTGPFGDVAVGDTTTCALTSLGTLRCWGDNGIAQFGNGNNTSSLTPVPGATTLAGLVDVDMGGAHGCALRGDGALFCWGSDFSGQLGDGANQSRWTPVAVPGGPFSKLALGWSHSCALTTAGRLACWGDNTSGQLGNGTGSNSNVPVLPALDGVTAVRTGPGVHVCTEMRDLSVRCWGGNDAGQLGTGTLAPSSVPSPVRMQ